MPCHDLTHNSIRMIKADEDKINHFLGMHKCLTQFLKALNAGEKSCIVDYLSNSKNNKSYDLVTCERILVFPPTQIYEAPFEIPCVCERVRKNKQTFFSFMQLYNMYTKEFKTSISIIDDLKKMPAMKVSICAWEKCENYKALLYKVILVSVMFGKNQKIRQEVFTEYEQINRYLNARQLRAVSFMQEVSYYKQLFFHDKIEIILWSDLISQDNSSYVNYKVPKFQMNFSGKTLVILLLNFSKSLDEYGGKITNELAILEKLIYAVDSCSTPLLVFGNINLFEKNGSNDEQMFEYSVKERVLNAKNKGTFQRTGIFELLKQGAKDRILEALARGNDYLTQLFQTYFINSN